MAELVDRNNNKTEFVYGKAPVGTLEQVKDACSNINWVRNDIREIKSYFIKLGFHLEEISRCEIYKVFGFDDFYEFCEANFHLSRSTVSRHINLFLRFCHRNGKYETPTMFIDERWKDYSYSQLCEMLPLPDWKLCDIKPEMTIAQIREYKKSLKEKDTSVDFASLDKLIDRAKDKACATSHKTLKAKVQGEPEMTVCDVAQTELLPDPETCEDDEDSEDDITFYFLASEVDAVMKNLHDLKLFLDDKSYDMALISLDVLCVRLKRFFGV